MPDPPSPPGLDDKTGHFLAYAGLGALAVRATSGGSVAGVTGGAVGAAWAIATLLRRVRRGPPGLRAGADARRARTGWPTRSAPPPRSSLSGCPLYFSVRAGPAARPHDHDLREPAGRARARGPGRRGRDDQPPEGAERAERARRSPSWATSMRALQADDAVRAVVLTGAGREGVRRRRRHQRAGGADAGRRARSTPPPASACSI